MPAEAPSDAWLLQSEEPGSFAIFYRRHVEDLLGFLMRRTGDAETAADLTAETFAAALVARRRFVPERGAPKAWLYGIALHKLGSWQRARYAEQRARARLGMERIELTDADIERIEALGESVSATVLLEGLHPDQRAAVVARVVEQREYDEIATTLETSPAVIRKRVSRGLAAVRKRLG